MIKSKLDTGIIEIPMIAPHLELFTFTNAEVGISDEAVEQNPHILNTAHLSFIVDSGGSGFDLKGAKMRDTLLAIDGKRSRHDIVDFLKPQYPANEITAILAHLAYRGTIISAEHSLDDGLAFIWSEAGVSPVLYEQFSASIKVHIVSLNDNQAQREHMHNAFDELGVKLINSIEESDLTAVLIDDYLQPELEQFNLQRLADKKRWIPIKAVGSELLFGPIFSPDVVGACLHCATNNMRNNRETRGFLSHYRKNALVPQNVADFELLSQARAVTMVFNILKHLILEKEMQGHKGAELASSIQFMEFYHTLKKLDEHIVSIHAISAEMNEHYVNKRPQCLSCGDKHLNDPSREPKAVELFHENASSVFTSGGMKAMTAEETLQKYDHLISPLIGIVTSIERSSPVDDEWMHVYWSGSNLAIVNRNFYALSNSIRSKSAGKGRSKNQAKVSALCEALERYSGVFNGDEIRKTAKFNDFPEGSALHPNDLMLFSEAQYQMREEIKQKEYRFYRLPDEDFDPEALVEWSPVWSITQNKTIWMMCYQLYFSYDPSFVGEEGVKLNRNFANPDSNGAAAGNTPAEAFVQGFMELIERDAYAIWWYNRLKYPEVDIASFEDPYLDMAVKRYQEKYNRKLWVLDITNDFGIPVFVAISGRTDKEKQDICISAGAHFNPHIALLRAVCELNQYISAVLKSTDEDGSYTYFDRECNDWWKNATLESDPYLVADENTPITVKATYPVIERDLNEEVQACIDAVHAKNLDILVLDQTRADINLPVMKVMVPGMRHFWARFAPGRLYDVPVSMGKLAEPTKEEDLNPTPVFI